MYASMGTGISTAQFAVRKLPHNVIQANFVPNPVQFPVKLCVKKPIKPKRVELFPSDHSAWRPLPFWGHEIWWHFYFYPLCFILFNVTTSTLRPEDSCALADSKKEVLLYDNSPYLREQWGWIWDCSLTVQQPLQTIPSQVSPETNKVPLVATIFTCNTL